MPTEAPGPDACLAAQPAAGVVGDLFAIFYEELRAISRRTLRHTGDGITLHTTALVNEAYLKMHRSVSALGRAEFLRLASIAMHHALVNYLRDRAVERRRTSEFRRDPAILPDGACEPADEILAVHQLVDRLREVNPRWAAVVECRFFAGYEEEQTAEILNVNVRTVRRDWVKARAWLLMLLSKSATPATAPAPTGS